MTSLIVSLLIKGQDNTLAGIMYISRQFKYFRLSVPGLLVTCISVYVFNFHSLRLKGLSPDHGMSPARGHTVHVFKFNPLTDVENKMDMLSYKIYFS